MNRPNTITVSDLYFHRKIMDRYQRRKVNPFGFPMMIFYKNTLPILKRVKMDISLRLYFSIFNQNTVSSSVLRNVWDMRRLFSWFGIEKPASSILKSIQGLSRKVWYEAMPLLPTVIVSLGGVSLLLSLLSQVEKGKEVNRRFFSYGACTQTIKPQASGMERDPVLGSGGRHSSTFFERKSPAILPHVDLQLSKKEVFRVYNSSINGPGLDAAGYITVRRSAVFNTESGDFYFHKQRRIEQEVEEIKKIVIETKEEMIEKSASHNYPEDVDSAIKRQLDIDRISDQVYRNIERRIRMEKERRGM